MPNSQPEWKLQTAIKSFVARCVAVPHLFAAHDRGRNYGGKQHMWEAARGAVAGWPDTELLLPDGKTFRCELKAAGGKPTDRQEFIGGKIAALGHPWAWADSVVHYYDAARAAGVPFNAAAPVTAEDFDLRLMARSATLRKATRPRKERPDAAKIRRVSAVRSRILF